MDQPDSGTIALLLYIAGVFVQALKFPITSKKDIQAMKEKEAELFKIAYSIECSREESLAARDEYETLRDKRAELEMALERTGDIGLSPVMSLLMGLAWPGFFLVAVYSMVKSVIAWISWKITEYYVYCEVCRAEGPSGITYKRARIKAVRKGWVVDFSSESDVCPDCATDRVTTER